MNTFYSMQLIGTLKTHIGQLYNLEPRLYMPTWIGNLPRAC